MASSKMNLDMAEKGMETSDKMVDDSETNPDLAQTTKGISETKIQRDSIDRELDSDLTKYKRYKSPTKPNQSAEDKYEMLKFQVYKFFKDNPETEEEKKMKKLQIHSLIKIQHEKCRELQELALGNTKVFHLMKKISLRFSKELSINHTFQELTNETENIMLEYGMCVDTDSMRRDLDPLELEAEVLVGMALELPNESSYADVNFETPVDFRPLEDCVRDILMVHSSAAGEEAKVRKRIKIQALASELKAKEKANEKEMSGLDEKEKEIQSNMEITDAEDSNAKKNPRPRKSYYRVYLDEEILNHRINFLKALQEMIRSSLRLFRRLNKAWLKPGETVIDRTLEQVKKQFRERSNTIDKRYYWNDLKSDLKGGDKETCQPNKATGSFKETSPDAGEKGDSDKNPFTKEFIAEILASEDNLGANLEALMNYTRIILSSDSFRSLLPARAVSVPEVVGDIVTVPKADSFRARC